MPGSRFINSSIWGFYWPPKLLYFSMCCVYFIFHTFRSIYLKEVLGITGRAYGAIAGSLSFMAMVGPILWTTLADRWNSHKECLIMATILQSTFFCGIAMLHRDTANVAIWTGCCLMLQMICQYGMQPLLDTKIFQMLNVRYNQENAKAYYGRQIMFGTMGYMVITNVVGRLYDQNENWIFYLTIVTTIVFVAFSIILVPGRCIDTKLSQEQGTQPGGSDCSSRKLSKAKSTVGKASLKHYSRLFKNPDYLFLLLVGFCNGFSRGMSSHFLPVFTKTEIVGNTDWVVWQAILGTVMEVLFFSVSKQAVEILGVYWMLVLAQVTCAIRFTFYAFIPLHQPIYIYPAMAIELLKGVNYVFIQVPGVNIATNSAPPELQSTSLGTFMSVFAGLAPAVAGVVGGYCSEIHSQLPFKLCSIVSWFTLGLVFVQYFFIKRYIQFGSKK